MATTFPNSIQTFDTMQNINYNDSTEMANVFAFQQAIKNGNYAQAQTIYNNITDADKKFINANLINTILDTCVALQEYYLSKFSNSYIVSETQPAQQGEGDFWFEVVV